MNFCRRSKWLTLTSIALAVVGAAAGHAVARETLVADAKALSAALKSATLGDVIVMREGVWMDTSIRIMGKGTAEQPITLRAQTEGKTVLSGKSNLRIAGQHILVDGLIFRDFKDGGSIISFQGEKDGATTDCRVTNCVIESPLVEALVPPAPADPAAPPGAPGVEAKDGSVWVGLYGQRNRVDHCYFKGKRTSSPLLVVWVEPQPNDHRIDHNYFAGRPSLGKNGGETIRVGTSGVSMNVSRTVVEDNLFEHCDGEIEIVSNKSCENIYRRNTFDSCDGMLTLRHGNRCVVDSNWFFGRGVKDSGGVRIIGEGHRVTNNYLQGLTGTGFRAAIAVMDGVPDSKPSGYLQVKNAVVAHNTIIDCASNIELGVGHGEKDRSLPSRDIVIVNNLIVSTKPALQVKGEQVNPLIAGNVIWGGDGSGMAQGFTQADPQLSPGADGISRPGRGSPVRGAGVPIAAATAPVATDINGNARGATWDIGCDQSGSAGLLAHPVTKAEVGPGWMTAGAAGH